jgi:hypothetical protein
VGYRFDYLVAPLRCECGRLAHADEMLEMTTRLRDEPNLAFLGVGDRLPVTKQRALECGYLLVREPAEPAVLVHMWACASCGYDRNWAEVVVRDGVIQEIEAVDLDQETLARAHFIVDDARDLAVALAGVPSSLGVADDEVVRILRDKLP